jgi:hypothetical protein
MGMLAFSGFLNRLVRVDPPLSQGAASVRLVWEALDKGNTNEAIDLTAYLIQEQYIGHEIFARWTERMAQYIVTHDPRQSLHDVHAATVQPWLTRTTAPYLSDVANQIPTLEVEGENVRYTWPNSNVEVKLYRQEDTYPLGVYVNGEQYAPVHKLPDSLREAMVSSNQEAARNGIEDVMVRNRLIHEIYCDWCWALLTNIRDTFGEENYGRAMRATMEDWITVRYKDMLDMSPEELLQLTIEGLRGEFFGSELLGDVEVTEEEDRYVLAFNPCGTGGRMRRGVPQLGTPPRTQAPYNFGVSHEAHDWSWNQAGVCLYCTHCADINELLPLDRVGRPMRVTEHPKAPGDKCRWLIYKKHELIPDKYYEQVGRKRPEHFISIEAARTDWRVRSQSEERGPQ